MDPNALGKLRAMGLGCGAAPTAGEEWGPGGASCVMGLVCRLFRHIPKRHRARHDGDYYWTTCERCAADLLRDRGGWREPSAREAARHESNLLVVALTEGPLPGAPPA